MTSQSTRLREPASKEGGAKRLAPDESIDPGDILAALGWPKPTRATAVTGGADTALWRVEVGGQDYALRLLRAEQAAAATREVAAMAAAGAVGLPAPAVHAAGNWRGRPALLLTWLPGCPLRHAVCANPPAAEALAVAFGRAQALLHGAPAPITLSSEPDAWIAAVNPDSALRRRLLAARNGPAVLLHLDYHPLNVLVAGGQVSAIVDWTNAQLGDPRADVARTATILRFAPGCDGLSAGQAEAVRRAVERGWRRGYQEIAGPLTGMAPFYAWAAAYLVRDLAPRVGRADLPWLTAALLDRVRAWGAAWLTSVSC